MAPERIAVVTGGAAGIGAAIAEALAGRGCHVVIADIDLSAAETLERRIGDKGGKATAKQFDISAPGQVAALFRTVKAELGSVTRLVNNAGIGRLVPFDDLSVEEWDRTLAVNLTGAIYCAKHAARQMAHAGGGRILNISSISGERASPGRVAYGTTKAAMQALTKQLAFELAPQGILSNCLLPGPVETEMAASIPTETRRAYEATVPAARFAAPEEIAEVAAYLMTDAPTFLTGACIPVDGGFLSAGLDALFDPNLHDAPPFVEAARAVRPAGQPVALVTGGANGIGRAICDALARDGHHVVIGDLDAAAAARAATEIAGAGGFAEALALNVANSQDAEIAIADVAARHGRLDVLVNNAGAGGIYPFLDLPDEEWERARSVNLTGGFSLTKAAAPIMRAQGFGRILFLSSVSGLRPARGRAAYAVSKAGVNAMARQFAVELAPFGVTVNTIAPGPIETDMARRLLTPELKGGFLSMVPAAQMGLPGDIASAALYLAQPETGFVTGQTLAIDGGYSISGLDAASLTATPRPAGLQEAS